MGDDYVTKMQRLLDAEKGVALTGSALNLIVIIYIFIKRRYRTSFSRAYLNMAIADFLYASFSLFFQLHPGFTVLSHLSCQIYVLLMNILVIADLLSIAPITTDRLIAVLLPIRYKQKSHVITMATITILCWITPILIESARAIYHSRITEDGSFVKIVNNMCQIINGRDSLSKKLNTVKHFLAMTLPLLYRQHRTVSLYTDLAGITVIRDGTSPMHSLILSFFPSPQAFCKKAVERVRSEKNILNSSVEWSGWSG